jgi:hypothetical protein
VTLRIGKKFPKWKSSLYQSGITGPICYLSVSLVIVTIVPSPLDPTPISWNVSISAVIGIVTFLTALESF